MNYLAVMVDYSIWWYSGGLKRLYLWLAALFGWLNNAFSVKRLLKTLFLPWRRLVGVKKPGLEGFRDLIIDNLVSRFVGFMIRSITLFIYLFALIFFFLFAACCFVFWVGLPLWIVISFIKVFV